LILFSGNRQIPGLATGAVGHSLKKSYLGMEGKISYHDHEFSRSSFQRAKSSSIDSARRALQNTRSSAKIQKPSQSQFFIWMRHKLWHNSKLIKFYLLIDIGYYL